MKIVFMGTPEFAVASLQALLENQFDVVAVVTVPDKPAGRGQQVQQSAVKKFAAEKNLPVLQPEKLKDPAFLSDLKALGADLFIVVAFRMLPEVVWSMPPKGCFNLHGSLLPQYRGAAPINRAVMNGEKETGVTTFFLQQQIDTGKILFQEKLPINDEATAGEIHDQLMVIGAKLVVKTVKAIESGEYTETDQSELFSTENELKHAAKIFREDCKLNFHQDVMTAHNQVRGLSPYPTAYLELQNSNGKTIQLKLFKTRIERDATVVPGTLRSDGKTGIQLGCKNGWLHLLDLQMSGKKRMSVAEFLRGFNLAEDWKAL